VGGERGGWGGGVARGEAVGEQARMRRGGGAELEGGWLSEEGESRREEGES